MSNSNDLQSLLKHLNPLLHAATYCYVHVEYENVGYNEISFCVVRENEGITYIMSQQDADANNLKYSFTGKLITLQVYSALDALGLTMAVSTALTKASIPCNIIAGYHHDHLLVPEEKAAQALQVLNSLAT